MYDKAEKYLTESKNVHSNFVQGLVPIHGPQISGGSSTLSNN